MERTTRHRALRIAALTALLAGCRTPATYVTVMVDTDAPTRVLSMRAITSRGASASMHPDVQTWARTGATDDFTLPSSFSIIPGDGPNDGTVTLQVELVFAPTSPGQPIVTARRTARFHFLPHQQNWVRLFLPASCAAVVVPPAHCADMSTPCTVSRYCEEQANQTCGEDGSCDSVDVHLTPIYVDGSVPTDSTRIDVPALDAPVVDVTPRDVPVTDTCVADCTGRGCGSNGCGGSCGTCPTGQSCDASGQCLCVPNCAARMCGDDGCGGSCGTCSTGTCNGAGQCVASCTPNCAGRTCGNDGCSGSCGSCGAGQMCNASGQCVCSPSCVGRACGNNGCGGSCGSCGSGQSCNASGQCVCAPNCAGRTCGNDGCGGSCGSCGSGQMCNGSGNCFACTMGASCSTGNPCTAGATDCSGGSAVCNVSGNRGAGTSCPGGVCNGSGTCVACSQGASCSTGNPCTTGAIDCSSGGPQCVANGSSAAGTSCAGGVCNGSGTCVACSQGASCTPPNDCIATATIECSSGSPVCTGRTFMPNGSDCSRFPDGSTCDGAGTCRCVHQTGQCTRCGLCNYSCSNPCL